jgi:hypothetical protein
MQKSLIGLLFIISFNAQALFLFEPYLGYGNGSFKNITEDTGSFKSLSAGSRLAYVDPLFMIGVDVRAMKQNYEANYVDVNNDDYLAMDINWLLGFHFGTLRLWYSFGTSGIQMEDGQDGFYYGNNDKWGLSYRFSRNVYINLEVIRQTYDEYEISNKSTEDLSSDLENRTFLLSLSFPFIF